MHLAREAMRAGADGYVLKDIPWENFLSAMRQVLSGRRYVQESVRQRLLLADIDGGAVGLDCTLLTRGSSRRYIPLLGMLTLISMLVPSCTWQRDQHSSTEDIADLGLPPGQAFVKSGASKHFKITYSVTVRDWDSPGHRLVTFDALVENLTDQPLRGVSVVAELPEGFIPFPTFGTMPGEKQHLVPGQIPYGIWVSKISAIPFPEELGPQEREDLLKALRVPIHMKVAWDEGVEYLVAEPERVEVLPVEPSDF